MANFATLIAEIEAYIKTNGEQEITGQILQNVLKDIVDTLGNGAVFKGIATTDGTPGTPDNNVFYLAVAPGTYTNYGGAVLDGSKLCALTYNGTWSKSEVLDLDDYAKIDGYYASLTAGAAENLVGRGSVPASFLFRTSGGTADLGTGSARITKLAGNSIVWNQLVGADTTAVTITSGNKYFAIIDGTASVGTSDGTAIAVTGGQDIFVDLTRLFNGNVPANYTAADFQADFPLLIYAYNAGQVIPFAAENLVTTGFNQWDGQFVANKAINASTGNESNDTGSAHTDYIPIFPNTMYWFRNCGISSGSLGIGYYDANKNFVSGSVVSEAGGASFRRLTPAGAYYMRVSFPLSQKDGVCINLQWSGYRDGEYEPYEKHTAAIAPASWLDTDGNLIFPYGGMHGVGTARDFAKPDADGMIRKATRVWERRAYAAGDESDPDVITDGSTYTFVQLETPVEKDLATPVSASYYVNDFGTEAWEPANDDEPYTASCHMEVAYAMNAVDTLRRLPVNYISKASFDNFCAELADKLGAALNKSVTITASYDAEDEEYDYAITIEDIEEG